MTDHHAPLAPSGAASSTTSPSTTTEDRMSTKSTAPAAGAQARTVAEHLSAGEPYVLAFGGQAPPWRAALEAWSGSTATWPASWWPWTGPSPTCSRPWPPTC